MIISENSTKSRIPNDHPSKLRGMKEETLNNLQIIRKENFPITEIITRHKGYDHPRTNT